MYENNFWYLFDVKKLTSLNYDNLKRYYVNLEGFLKSDNFFDLDGIDLFSDLKVFFTKKKKDSDKYT
jgi:glucan-binding YG repeat protein